MACICSMCISPALFLFLLRGAVCCLWHHPSHPHSIPNAFFFCIRALEPRSPLSQVCVCVCACVFILSRQCPWFWRAQTSGGLSSSLPIWSILSPFFSSPNTGQKTHKKIKIPKKNQLLHARERANNQKGERNLEWAGGISWSGAGGERETLKDDRGGGGRRSKTIQDEGERRNLVWKNFFAELWHLQPIVFACRMLSHVSLSHSPPAFFLSRLSLFHSLILSFYA